MEKYGKLENPPPGCLGTVTDLGMICQKDSDVWGGVSQQGNGGLLHWHEEGEKVS